MSILKQHSLQSHGHDSTNHAQEPAAKRLRAGRDDGDGSERGSQVSRAASRRSSRSLQLAKCYSCGRTSKDITLQ